MHAQMTVSQVMHTPNLVLSPQQSVTEALDALLAAGISAAPVVGNDGRLLGFLSEHDLLIDLWCCDYQPDQPLTVAELMQAEVDALAPGDNLMQLAETICVDVGSVFPTSDGGSATSLCALPLRERARRSRQWRPHHYPVVDQGQLVGMVSRRDLMQALRPLYAGCA
ncbi:MULTISPECIES: CBS domain-containing protein [Ferrimonas]|uniref:CBS domain-containing protein n=1 Tax=Ferrimonas TaxID=44011 RepID=UPI0003F713DD|nr:MULTISPECIES: CBS domain-containing protein [Ferrimonas]USD36610.1 CBS domain-containing protein [Ferrimonas sp. SCSIO 43195]